MNTARVICSQCLRPKCLCFLIRSVNNRCRVTILQHPQEVGHSKNTARLLHLCLSNSQLLEGEDFSKHIDINKLSQKAQPHQQTVLLYPAKPGQASIDIEECDPANTHLIVPDGTWRKTRKMLHLCPVLDALPRLNFTPHSTGAYHIRKARKSTQLSTLEAVSQALQALEGLDIKPLQDVMSEFMLYHEQLRSR